MLRALLDLPIQKTTVAFPRGRLSLRVMTASGGTERVATPGYNWSGLKRGLTPFAVIQHTLAGAGALTYEGRSYALTPGTTMLLNIPHDHRYFLPAGGDWTFFYLVLSGQEAMRLTGEVIAAAGPVLHLTPPALDRLAACVIDIVGGYATTPGEASGIGYRAVMALVDDLSSMSALTGDENHPDWLLRTIAHIDLHPGNNLNVEELSAVAGLSRAHFVRQFTRLAGAPPSEYVFRTRMARAARLLQSTGLTVLEIATSLGFADPNYFAKAFRRAFDVSPSEFKLSGLFTVPDAPRLPARADATRPRATA